MKILTKIKEIYNKVMAFLNSVANDKLKHFITGLFIAFGVGIINPLWGLAAAIVVGCTKELYDAFTSTNKADWMDLLATCIGGVVGMIMVLL